VITNAVKLSLTRLSPWSLRQPSPLSELASPELASWLFATCWGVCIAWESGKVVWLIGVS